MTKAKPCPHYCDNQGFCHRCGILMEPYLYDLYLNGPPKPPAKKRTKTKKGKRCATPLNAQRKKA